MVPPHHRGLLGPAGPAQGALLPCWRAGASGAHCVHHGAAHSSRDTGIHRPPHQGGVRQRGHRRRAELLRGGQLLRRAGAVCQPVRAPPAALLRARHRGAAAGGSRGRGRTRCAGGPAGHAPYRAHLRQAAADPGEVDLGAGGRPAGRRGGGRRPRGLARGLRRRAHVHGGAGRGEGRERDHHVRGARAAGERRGAPDPSNDRRRQGEAVQASVAHRQRDAAVMPRDAIHGEFIAEVNEARRIAVVLHSPFFV
mmetsp:Transcript_17018/g.43618  ORF Transcript_17018/g.43618 Transcript_17018/m.43618 type:complete len:253 (-) Transcript_17018:170-928(-)